MRIRQGFVSNSSSSSFVVAAKEGQMKVKISTEIDLTEFVDHIIKYTSDIEDNYIVSNYVDEIIENYDISRDNLHKLLDDGYTIYEGSFSDEDSPEEALLCEEGLSAVDFKGKILFSQCRY